MISDPLHLEEDRKSFNIPKYMNTKFPKANHLFGLYEAKQSIIQSNMVYVVEGQFDCIAAHDKGLTNVVALGSSNMAFNQFALLMRYTNNIMVLLDNDQAGQLGTEKIVKYYSKYANVKGVAIPKDFKDVDEYLGMYDKEDLILTLRK